MAERCKSVGPTNWTAPLSKKQRKYKVTPNGEFNKDLTNHVPLDEITQLYKIWNFFCHQTENFVF